ncbi:uncharacterized protein BCR38DRAFT_96370 [Pseudomassariella vexata]|uniref:Uncharacterized protein n=1 Tax=Pseudomassariella vexata TaxID=1141098 RepID=A0A1Y2EEG0_9PEZI|nr:uncharacterized protein BCR38DRAFT_96370 [Pseudomassariella vexata]ORY69958.1 hypothetical protein BCR38DRAFT_96370 [Pseudomassariella vexata]
MCNQTSSSLHPALRPSRTSTNGSSIVSNQSPLSHMSLCTAAAMAATASSDVTTTLSYCGGRPDHPTALVTDRNTALSLLLRLPLELRLMIYEYATYAGKPIWPEQVAPGSNKFTWGENEVQPAYNHPGWSMDVKVPKEGDRLVFPKLAIVCRQIYLELETWPVFYRVNQFCFRVPNSGLVRSSTCVDKIGLHRFLAALTPARRNMIRHIKVSSFQCLEQIDNILNPRPGVHLIPDQLMPDDLFISRQFSTVQRMSDTFVLLTQCTQLRELQLTSKFEPNGKWTKQPSSPNPPWDYLSNILQLCREVIRFQGVGWSYFSLPGFQYVVALPGLDLDLFDGQHIHKIPKGTEDWLKSTDHLDEINQVKDIFTSYKKRVASEPEALKNLVSDLMLQDSVRASKLDFPGEARKAPDLHAIPGPISKRTRGQAKGLRGISRWGTLNDGKQQKYDLEGRLVWNISKVCNARWREDWETIEVEVEWLQPGNGPATSWEELYTISTRWGLFTLENFYRHVWGMNRINIAEVLRILQSLPTPKDVIDAVQTIGFGEDEYTHSKNWKQTIRRWRDWDVRWKRDIDKFEKLAAKINQQQHQVAAKKGRPAKRRRLAKCAKTVKCALSTETLPTIEVKTLPTRSTSLGVAYNASTYRNCRQSLKV